MVEVGLVVVLDVFEKIDALRNGCLDLSHLLGGEML